MALGQRYSEHALMAKAPPTSEASTKLSDGQANLVVLDEPMYNVYFDVHMNCQGTSIKTFGYSRT